MEKTIEKCVLGRNGQKMLLVLPYDLCILIRLRGNSSNSWYALVAVIRIATIDRHVSAKRVTFTKMPLF